MKRVIVFRESDPFSSSGSYLRGVFSSVEIAYNYLNDYLDYLKYDAEINIGGDRLNIELSRINILRKNIEEILDWDLNDDSSLHGMSCYGFHLDTMLCYESEEDLPKSQKEKECSITF